MRESPNTEAVCECNEGRGGKGCDTPVCPGNCSGIGHCSIALGHVCICPAGRTGADCSQRACPAGCAAPRGQCVGGKCMCAIGWSGAACDEPMCDKACSHHGRCTLRGCECDEGWTGQDCSQRRCDHDCLASLGQGACHDGKCVCSPGFSGPVCNSTCGAGFAGQPLCSGHGQCVVGRECHCDPGYTGAHCESRTCLMGCAGHGVCHDGECVCALGYGGQDCALTTVPSPRDCSTGCVHVCATHCSEEAAATTGGGALSQQDDCFGACRKRCSAACQSHSAHREIWVSGRRHFPTAGLAAAAAASAALHLPVPTAAVIEPIGGFSVERRAHARQQMDAHEP